jgi:MFS family permease
MLTPLQHPGFRRLLTGMSISYAGDRLQDLAQAWLVATLSSSALAVAGISMLSLLPQLLTSLGGVLGDRVNRSRLLLLGQSLGAILSFIMAGLIFFKTIAIWQVYTWAFASGLIWLFSRPAYKVVLIESVPEQKARAAVALNSVSETASMLTVSSLGSWLLVRLGLPIAFLLNALSYLTAGLVLWTLRNSGVAAHQKSVISSQSILGDLRAGFGYLAASPKLFQPLLMTFLMVLLTSPSAGGVLAAIVHKDGASVMGFGLLSAAGGAGALLGAIYAGTNQSSDPNRLYAFYGMAAALALVVFALVPIGVITALPLAMIGFILFAQAVWNTSRVRLLADSAYQTRVQAITTMVFTIGSLFGQLWAGIVVDHFGKNALVSGAVVLAGLCIMSLLNSKNKLDLEVDAKGS